MNVDKRSVAALDEEFLRILSCPICPDRPSLAVSGDYLTCSRCKNAFAIVDGIPQLAPEDAVPLDQL
jgi:uncharacterized protein YbaR (Trm112 family)